MKAEQLQMEQIVNVNEDDDDARLWNWYERYMEEKEQYPYNSIFLVVAVIELSKNSGDSIFLWKYRLQ